MLWSRAPPSDQLENAYVVPPSVCGVGVPIEFREPTITVRVKGVGWVAAADGDLEARRD